MPHASSPIVYPFSLSPPQTMESTTTTKKRYAVELQAYPSKKRTLPSSERLESSAPILLGSTLSLKKQSEANKENLLSVISPSQILDYKGDCSTVQLDGFIRNVELEQVSSKNVFSSHSKASSGLVRFGCGLTLTENLPRVKTSRGDIWTIRLKHKALLTSSDNLNRERLDHFPGEAKKNFYGIDVHNLLQKIESPLEVAGRNAHDIRSDKNQPLIAEPPVNQTTHRGRTMLWAEKYRARKFTDLIGDDRTHRDVLRWLKSWDSIVFPGSSQPKPICKIQKEGHDVQNQTKILLLTGSPGLGKTTLAHVCAKQAGYEVLEINASDERSRDIVNGKIRDCVGTENVKGISLQSDHSKIRQKGRPFCVVVDEVDGAVSGGSGGESGFIKALVELVLLDQKTLNASSNATYESSRAKKKGEKFRLLRPIILICNDVYHSSLRLLRAKAIAEIVHIGKPPLDKVLTRLGFVFNREGIPHDADAVRRLCEATWGIQKQRERSSQPSGTGGGDVRSLLMAAEWVASKLRQQRGERPRLTKKWIEDSVLESLWQGGEFALGIGRSGAKEAVERVFQDSAGFTNSELLATSQANISDLGICDARGLPEVTKRTAMQRLREIVNTSGESDHIVADCFAAYPLHQFRDDTFLSKPNTAYDWLYFHDRLSSRVHCAQEWDLHGYLSEAILGLHRLFASPARHFGSGNRRQRDEDVEQNKLFMGPRPDFEFSEVTRENKAILHGLNFSLSTALLRGFGSVANMSTDLLPNVLKMLTPAVKPVTVGGSGTHRGVVSVRTDVERRMIQRAVKVMSTIGVSYQQSRIDSGQIGVGNGIYRMEPPLDALTTYQTASQTERAGSTRYAIRQALDQEYRKFQIKRSDEIRRARYKAGGPRNNFGADEERTQFWKGDNAKAAEIEAPKRDFFGRVVGRPSRSSSVDGGESDEQPRQLTSKSESMADRRRIWVTFHEGFSNAVRKPITLVELLQGF